MKFRVSRLSPPLGETIVTQTGCGNHLTQRTGGADDTLAGRYERIRRLMKVLW
jgi:hypothetical protein